MTVGTDVGALLAPRVAQLRRPARTLRTTRSRATSPTALFRGAVLALCTVFASLEPHGARALPWLVALLVGAVLVAPSTSRKTVTRALVLETVVTAAGVPLTGGPHSPLLTYLLAPLVVAGVLLGVRRLVVVSATALGSLLLAEPLAGCRNPLSYGVESLRWVALGTACALVGDWAVQMRQSEQPYERALTLLTQLRQLTLSLPGSLDAWSVGGTVLEMCSHDLPVRRGAVLVQVGDTVAPVAVQGGSSLPWRNPLTDEGPLGDAWMSRNSVRDVRTPDEGGRRRGSGLLALPVVVADRTVALVVLESGDHEAFPDAVVRRLENLVAEHALRIETALVFEDLRRAASVEERERLAHEMHDGVAQDLAAVGFSLDYIRRTASEPAIVDLVNELRTQVIGMVANIRLSITQLRGTIAPERGLGAALGQYARSASTGTGMTAHLSLSEGCFRLPLEAEVELLRIAQSVIGAARGAEARGLWVDLVTEAPAARMRLSHDGVRAGLDERQLAERAERIGAALDVEPQESGGVTVSVMLGGNL